MKVIKDAFASWLEDEIAKETTLCNDFLKNTDRLDALVQCRTKLNQIIMEEFAKLEGKDHA